MTCICGEEVCKECRKAFVPVRCPYSNLICKHNHEVRFVIDNELFECKKNTWNSVIDRVLEIIDEEADALNFGIHGAIDEAYRMALKKRVLALRGDEQ